MPSDRDQDGGASPVLGDDPGGVGCGAAGGDSETITGVSFARPLVGPGVVEIDTTATVTDEEIVVAFDGIDPSVRFHVDTYQSELRLHDHPAGDPPGGARSRPTTVAPPLGASALADGEDGGDAGDPPEEFCTRPRVDPGTIVAFADRDGREYVDSIALPPAVHDRLVGLLEAAREARPLLTCGEAAADRGVAVPPVPLVVRRHTVRRGRGTRSTTDEYLVATPRDDWSPDDLPAGVPGAATVETTLGSPAGGDGGEGDAGAAGGGGAETGGGGTAGARTAVEWPPGGARDDWATWRAAVGAAGTRRTTHTRTRRGPDHVLHPPGGRDPDGNDQYGPGDELTLVDLVDEWRCLDAGAVVDRAVVRSISTGDLPVGLPLRVVHGRDPPGETVTGVVGRAHPGAPTRLWHPTDDGRGANRRRLTVHRGTLHTGPRNALSTVVRARPLPAAALDRDRALRECQERAVADAAVGRRAGALDVTVEETWETRAPIAGADRTDRHARLTVAGPDLDGAVTVETRNAVDVGWTATVADDGADLGDEARAAVVRAARTQGPLATGVRT